MMKDVEFNSVGCEIVILNRGPLQEELLLKDVTRKVRLAIESVKS